MESAVQFQLIDLLLAMTLSLSVRHTLHKSQVWCHAVLSFQFTYAPLRGRTQGGILLLLVFIL